MTIAGQKLTLDCPASYQIEAQGYLDEHWSDWFDGMAIVPQVDAEGPSITRLTGTVVDQAALHGLLRKLYDLGLPLLSVNRFEDTLVSPSTPSVRTGSEEERNKMKPGKSPGFIRCASYEVIVYSPLWKRPS